MLGKFRSMFSEVLESAIRDLEGAAEGVEKGAAKGISEKQQRGDRWAERDLFPLERGNRLLPFYSDVKFENFKNIDNSPAHPGFLTRKLLINLQMFYSCLQYFSHFPPYMGIYEPGNRRSNKG